MINNFINDPFSVDEVRVCIRKLKNGKAAGVDNVLNEFIKYCPVELYPVFTLLFNMVLETGFVPTIWAIGIINALYKNKGSKDDVDNYRGITLLSCLGKLFTSLINNRLYDYLTRENMLGNEQAGFRKDHSTLDHIFTLSTIVNFYTAHKKQIYCAFIDYRKAFDSIDRVSLWQKLLDSNVNGKILTVIKNLYNKAKSCVRANNRTSGYFPCSVGVRQGENLSPLLFAIYLNDFKNAISRKFNGLTLIRDSINNVLSTDDANTYFNLFCLLYADDTVVMAESYAQMQKALDGVCEYCDRWALKVNTDKTKVVIFSRGKVRRYKTFNFGDEVIDVVYDYDYLGTTFNYNGKFNKAKAKQCVQAKKATFLLLRKKT